MILVSGDMISPCGSREIPFLVIDAVECDSSLRTDESPVPSDHIFLTWLHSDGARHAEYCDKAQIIAWGDFLCVGEDPDIGALSR